MTQSHPFPPTPPIFRPPIFPPSSQLPPSHCNPTQPCPPTPPHNISPSRSPTGSPAGSAPGSHSTPQSSTDARIYGCDLNEHWQSDKDCYDNKKINGLTLPRTIRSSAFTQTLDIEGWDPLSLPLAASLYQQANHHWIRKLASGREMYPIPTGDIASVVFMTELLRGMDLDRVAMTKARQEWKLMDKTSNTKYVAQVIAQFMQSWIPVKATDPDSQHEIIQLRQQVG